jgi:hypothetical protein
MSPPLVSATARAMALTLSVFMTSVAVAAATQRFAPVRVVSPVQSELGADVVPHLHHIVTIGSTVDPMNGDQNPYGLTVAPVTAGKMTAGDLVICNFNDQANIQGLGTTVEVLHPTPGSEPAQLAADPALTGCNAISFPAGADFLWVAALDANDDPVVGPDGSVTTALTQYPWTGPWGQAFSGTPGFRGVAAFYESNSSDGSIVRINLTKKGAYTFDKIATGFNVNHGVQGKILGAAGLTYDAKRDVLYIVDGNSDRVVGLKAPGMIPKHGIVVNGSGFSGPFASSAFVLLAGAPLKAPISSALLFNGNLVVGNTTNNRLIEVTPFGHVLAEKLLDSGATGALFGIVATGTSKATTKIYFNDDNDNTVKVLEQ